MKTKVRITRSHSGFTYDTLTMDVLGPRFKSSSRHLAVMGTLTWQGDSKFNWYGLNFNMYTPLEKNEDLYRMYKLSCYIKERITSTDHAPIEVMGIIGGEEHFYVGGDFISILDNGKQLYQVCKETESSTSYLHRFAAANSIMAQRIVDGMVKRNELADGLVIKPTGERLQFTPTNLEY